MYSFIHFLMVFIGTITGFTLANFYSQTDFFIELFPDNTMIFTSLFFGSSGYLLGVLVAGILNHAIKKFLNNINLNKVLPSVSGMVIGLVIINLILIPFYIFVFNFKASMFINYLKFMIPMFFNICFGFFGAKAGEKYFLERSDFEKGILVDSNIIIDGRIKNIMKLDFINRNMFISDKVLEELQLLSDKSDKEKRDKGRRALDLVNILKKDGFLNVIHDNNIKENTIDNSLIEISLKHNMILFSNDYNLIKKAQVNDIKTLFLKDLEDSLKPDIEVEDTFKIKLVKEGKDKHQAVGYLPDGTMIVAQNGRESIGKQVEVKVQNIVHTNAGKIIFVDVI